MVSGYDKSTLLGILDDLDRPTEGKVYIGGVVDLNTSIEGRSACRFLEPPL